MKIKVKPLMSAIGTATGLCSLVASVWLAPTSEARSKCSFTMSLERLTAPLYTALNCPKNTPASEVQCLCGVISDTDPLEIQIACSGKNARIGKVVTPSESGQYSYGDIVGCQGTAYDDGAQQ